MILAVVAKGSELNLIRAGFAILRVRLRMQALSEQAEQVVVVRDGIVMFLVGE